MKNLLLLLILSLTLSAENKTYEIEDVLQYSDIKIKDSLSLYAGKINMDFFDESKAYSIGLIFDENEAHNMHYGLGYIQPSSKFNIFTDEYAQGIDQEKEDGVVFFMNYNF